MAYRIDYHNTCCKKESMRIFPCILMTALFFYVFLILVSLYWSDGREVLRLLIISEDIQTTAKAADVFAHDLGNGESIRFSILSFWRNITEHADIH